MAKKAVDSDGLAVGIEQYEVKHWKGMPLYVCKVCGWDTLKVDEIGEHVEGHAARSMDADAASTPTPPTSTSSVQRPTAPQQAGRGDEDGEELFEVELVEVESTVDAQGTERKKFTIKEN